MCRTLCTVVCKWSFKVFLTVVNWVSPSTLPAATLQAQADILSQVLHQSDKNAALVLTPMFTYKHRNSWQQEEIILKTLAKRALFFDHTFSLLFQDKLDCRDNRPLAYNGRVVFAGHVQANKSAWKASGLLACGRTECAAQLAAKDMIIVEDLGPDALPTSVDDSTQAVVQATPLSRGSA